MLSYLTTTVKPGKVLEKQRVTINTAREGHAESIYWLRPPPKSAKRSERQNMGKKPSLN